MKLPRVTTNDPVERLPISVRKSTADLLEAYRTRYKQQYGDAIEKSALVENILRMFIQSDKDFMKWFEQGGNGAGAGSNPSTQV